MQDGALASDGDGKIISGETGKYDEHGSISSGYKTRRRKKEVNIPNNPECLSWPLGGKCGNTAKGKSGGVGLGRQQR